MSQVHYHTAAWYIKQGLPVPPGVANVRTVCCKGIMFASNLDADCKLRSQLIKAPDRHPLWTRMTSDSSASVPKRWLWADVSCACTIMLRMATRTGKHMP